MANLCSNKVILSSSSPKKATELYQRINNKCDGIFQYLHPMPEELSTESTAEQQCKLKEKFGFSNWYDWKLEQWGTNRDIATDDVYSLEFENETLTMFFDTAWSPPIRLYEFLSENGWYIEAYYFEESEGFCGKWDSKSGDECMEWDCNNISPIIVEAFELDPDEWRDEDFDEDDDEQCGD